MQWKFYLSYTAKDISLRKLILNAPSVRYKSWRLKIPCNFDGDFVKFSMGVVRKVLMHLLIFLLRYNTVVFVTYKRLAKTDKEKQLYGFVSNFRNLK